jgi:hypothetical protein
MQQQDQSRKDSSIRTPSRVSPISGTPATAGKSAKAGKPATTGKPANANSSRSGIRDTSNSSYDTKAYNSTQATKDGVLARTARTPATSNIAGCNSKTSRHQTDRGTR